MARAMLNSPKLLLADEPTGNLDPDNSRIVLDFLKGFTEQGGAVLMVTHSSLARGFADRELKLREGRLSG